MPYVIDYDKPDTLPVYYVVRKTIKPEKPIHRLYKPTKAVIKQELWRRKQIQMLYLQGRPLFGTYVYDWRDIP